LPVKVLDRRVRSASVKDPIHRRPGNVHYRSRTVLRKPPEVVYAGPANETPERYGVASVEEIIARLQASHQKAAEAVQLLTAAENTAMQLQGQMAAAGVMDKAMRSRRSASPSSRPASIFLRTMHWSTNQ